MLLLALAVWVAEPGRAAGRPLVTGFLVGMIFLARFDLVVPASLVAAWALLRANGDLRTRARRAAIGAAAAGAVAAPWIVTLVSSGGLQPDSARAEEHLLGHGGSLQAGPVIARFLARNLDEVTSPFRAGGLAAVLVAVVAALAIARAPAAGRLAAALWPLPAGIVLQLAAVSLVTGYATLWYVYAPLAGLAVVAIVGAGVLADGGTTARRVAGGVCIAALLGLCQQPARHALAFAPQQEDLERAVLAIRRAVPPGERVGVFSAGLVAWELPGRIVNLDGVVNGAVQPWLRADDLCPYLRATRSPGWSTTPPTSSRSPRCPGSGS